MAQKRKNRKSNTKNNTESQYNEAKLLRHISRLALRTKEDYRAWCRQNGFSVALGKSDLQRQQERQKHARNVSMQRLRQHSREGKLRVQIVKISQGEVRGSELGSDLLLEIFTGFKRCKSPKLLLETLLYLERRSKLISNPRYVQAVVALVFHHASWIRPVNHWRPQKHNASRQFGSLVRHLLADYDVPEFMDGVWFSAKRSHQKWFIHIGTGHNIRTAEGLPIELTRKMAHLYLQAPATCSVLTAFRWAQVQSLGGDKKLTDEIAGTILARRFKDNDFWLSVLRFFVNNPMLDRVHVHPIIDYIWNEKYVDLHDYDADGRMRNNGPAQPNFTMRGRTSASLLAQVDAWHRRLGMGIQSVGTSHWRRWTIADFRFVEGNRSSGTECIWQIRELLSSKELVAEGRKQKHCVASYVASCSTGVSAIYTMDFCDNDGERKLLTIEVHRKSRVVCQVRGKRNRLPTKTEASIVRRWAQVNNLK